MKKIFRSKVLPVSGLIVEEYQFNKLMKLESEVRERKIQKIEMYIVLNFILNLGNRVEEVWYVFI